MIPAALPCTGLVAGIVLYSLGVAWPCAVIAAAAGALALLGRRGVDIGVLVLSLSAGWLITWLHRPGEAPAHIVDRSTHLIEAVVDNVSHTTRTTVIISTITEADGAPVDPFALQIMMMPGDEVPARGDIITLTSAIMPVSTWHDVPHEIDMSSYYRLTGIAAFTFAEADAVTVTGHRDSWTDIFTHSRDRIIHMLAHSGVDDTTFAVLSAILTGYDDELPAALREDYRVAGIAHALALSGFHIGIIVLLVTLALYPLRLYYRLRRLRLALTFLLVWAYVAFTGFPLSATRAVVMVSVYIATLLLGRRHSPANALCVAVMIICAADPRSIFSPGLQLSVSAVAGILAFARPLNPVSQRNRLAYNTVSILTVPVAAVLGTLPFTIYHFHSLPVLFIPVNVLVAVLMPVWMFGGIIMLVFIAAGLNTSFLVMVLDALTRLISQAAHFIASISFSSVDNLYMSPVSLAVLVAVIAAAAVAVRSESKRAVTFSAIAAVAGCLFLAIPQAEAIPESEILLSRQYGSTAVLVRHGAKVDIYHSSSKSDRHHIAERIEGYLATRGVSEIGIADLGTSKASHILIEGDHHSLIIPHFAASDTAGRHKATYLLVGTLYRGKPDRLLATYGCDTVLLGVELSPKRAAAITRECALRHIPVINLHTTPTPPRL